MHREAYEWVETVVGLIGHPPTVIDLGSRDANGTPRDLFPNAKYLGVDVTPGENVDIVLDASTPNIDEIIAPADCVVSTELLEHAVNPAAIVANAYKLLKPGGVLILTCAGLGRPPHGQHGDPTPATSEHYRNIDPDDLKSWLSDAGFESWTIDVRTNPNDVRCFAVRQPLLAEPSVNDLAADPDGDDESTILGNISPDTKFMVLFVHDRHPEFEFIHFLYLCGQYGIPVLPQLGKSRVAAARNALITRALKTPVQWFLLLDDDHAVSLESVNKLVSSVSLPDRPIVGGLTYRRNPDWTIEPTAYKLRVDSPTEFYRLSLTEIPEEDTILEVDMTGAACLLVHRSVFETMRDHPEMCQPPYIWFQDTQIGNVEFGEDMTFCMRAKELGYRIFINTGAEFPHMKVTPLNTKMFRTQQRERGVVHHKYEVEVTGEPAPVPSRPSIIPSAETVERTEVTEPAATEMSLLTHYDQNVHYFSPLMQWTMTEILEKAEWKYSPGESVLDLGCGDGRAAGFFAPKDYFGIDYSAERIKVARDQHPSHAFEMGRAQDWRKLVGLTDPATSTRMFDLVIAIDLLEHLENPMALVNDIWEHALTDNGIMVATVPIGHVYHAHLQVWNSASFAAGALDADTWAMMPSVEGMHPYVVLSWDARNR